MKREGKKIETNRLGGSCTERERQNKDRKIRRDRVTEWEEYEEKGEILKKREVRKIIGLKNDDELLVVTMLTKLSYKQISKG
jgi:hypothetical protein